MSKTKVPDLPDVPSNIDPSLRKFCEAVRQVIQVREGVRGDALDSAVTFRDLTDGNLISVRQAGRSLIISPSTVTDLTQPPLVQDLSAAGALASIILAWLTPEYTNHAYTEIWRAQINDTAQASQVGMASGGLYVDYVARNTTGFEYYYWARNVSIYGIKGEFGIAGVLGVTSADPTALLELLNGQLNESKLTASLRTRINLIDDSGVDLTPVNSRIKAASNLIQEQLDTFENEVTVTTTLLDEKIGQVELDLFNTTTSLTNADLAIIQSVNTLRTTVNGNSASITTLNAGLASTNQALATSNTTLTARVNASDASISTLNTGLATTNQTLASTTTSLSARINNNAASITTLNAGLVTTNESLAATTSSLNAKIDDNTADITTLNAGLVTTNQALATSTTSLSSRINANAASITTLNSSLSTTNQALATSTTQLTARLNNAAGAGITVEQAFSAQANVNTGLYGQYTVKINNTTDKYVTGFGLAQTSVNGQTVGEFSIIADKFSIAPVATSPTASDGSPFYHLTAPTTVNGVTIQPGTYMKKAFIASATIGNAEIADAAITSAKIAELQASKITFNEALGQFFSAAVIRGGSISGTTITGNTITGGEIIGSRIRVGGTAEYPNVEISNDTNSLRTYSETYLDNKPLRYSEVSDGNVTNFRLFPAGQGTFAYQPTKALTNVYSDVSNNGELVTLPGFWEDQPNIIVSLSSIQLYESSLNAVDQKVVCAATNLKRLSTDPNNPGYYQYSFIPVVTLVASASDGVVPIKGQEIITNLSGSTGFAPVLGASIAAPATSSTFIMPANVSSGVITLSQDRYRCYVQGGSGNEVDVNGVESVTKLYVNNTLVFISPAYRQSYPRDSLSPLNNYQIAFGPVPAGTAYVQTTFGEFQAHNNSSNAYNTYRLRTSIYSAINSVSVLTSSASALAQGILSWTAIGR